MTFVGFGKYAVCRHHVWFDHTFWNKQASPHSCYPFSDVDRGSLQPPIKGASAWQLRFRQSTGFHHHLSVAWQVDGKMLMMQCPVLVKPKPHTHYKASEDYGWNKHTVHCLYYDNCFPYGYHTTNLSTQQDTKTNQNG